MVLTPRFTLSQTTTHVTIIINLPYIRVSSSETIIDGTLFSFWCAPYLLKLTFPSNLVDGDSEGTEAKAVYNPDLDNGTLTVNILKDEEGEWPDLALSSLLIKPKLPAGSGRIEVVDSTLDEEGGETVPVRELEGCPPPPPGGPAANDDGYGFGLVHAGVFAGLRGDLQASIFPVNCDAVGAVERRRLRREEELRKWDKGRYQAGWFDEAGEFEPLREEGGGDEVVSR